MTAADEPRSRPDLRALLLDYLDHYREVVAAQVSRMSEREAVSSRLPSGWTPAQLLNHLAFMEQRWFVWGFLGEPVAEPWGDWDGEVWATPKAPVAELVEALHRGGKRTREVVEAHQLDEVASTGGRFAEEPAPHLHWILLHVLQEYARHAGQVDIVSEVAAAQA